MGGSQSSRGVDRKKIFIRVFLFTFKVFFLSYTLMSIKERDVPTEIKLVSNLAGAITAGLLMASWYAFVMPKYVERCREKARLRIERKRAMGKQPSKWDKVLEYLLCGYTLT